jgi:pyruvate kinase
VNAVDRKANRASTDLDAVKRLRDEVISLAAEVERNGEARLASWRPGIERAAFEAGSENLAHYLALRGHDLRRLQLELSDLGLSSLGRCEAHVMASLLAVTGMLRRATGAPAGPFPARGWKTASRQDIDRQCTLVFGPDPAGPRSRIMATIGAESADEPQSIRRLVEAGTDCFRINCAHDERATWLRLIEAVRKASADCGRETRILMDIAGPKIRISEVSAGESHRVHVGDMLRLGERHRHPSSTAMLEIAITEPQLLKQLRVGQAVAIDDGKVGAVVERSDRGGVVLRVTRARPKGVKIKVGKGLNFPDLELDLSPLTAKDLGDLDFVAKHADIVGYSFVQRGSDIRLLQDELGKRRPGRPLPPLIIKIETRLGVANLPELIVTAAGRQPTAVMIARGDLAVELGLNELSETQEQLLWLCEAAHIPVVWATEVLGGLLKTGLPSRAEITDAAMAQRAECVMLNKGRHALEAVQLLDNILHRMDNHVIKKSPLLGPLSRWTTSSPVRPTRVGRASGGRSRQRKVV